MGRPVCRQRNLSGRLEDHICHPHNRSEKGRDHIGYFRDHGGIPGIMSPGLSSLPPLLSVAGTAVITLYFYRNPANILR